MFKNTIPFSLNSSDKRSNFIYRRDKCWLPRDIGLNAKLAQWLRCQEPINPILVQLLGAQESNSSTLGARNPDMIGAANDR